MYTHRKCNRQIGSTYITVVHQEIILDNACEQQVILHYHLIKVNRMLNQSDDRINGTKQDKKWWFEEEKKIFMYQKEQTRCNT